MTRQKKENKNTVNSVCRIVKYAKKRRSMAVYAVRVLNCDADYLQNIRFAK